MDESVPGPASGAHGDVSHFDASLGDVRGGLPRAAAGDDSHGELSRVVAGDDSLLNDELLGAADVGTDRGVPMLLASSRSSPETPEQVQAQMRQLQELNALFETYESALTESVDQVECFARRVRETDALLDTYVDILKQAQRRRALLSDPQWHGTASDAAQGAQDAARAREEQRDAEQRDAVAGRRAGRGSAAQPNAARASAAGARGAPGAASQRQDRRTAPAAGDGGRKATAVRPDAARASTSTDDRWNSLQALRLLDAMRSNDRAAVEAALAPFGEQTPRAQLESPVHLAVLCAEPEMLEWILRHPYIDANAVAADTLNTPLHMAVMSNRLDAASLLLAMPGVDDAKTNAEGKTPQQLVTSMDMTHLLQTSRIELRAQILEALEQFEDDPAAGERRLLELIALSRINAVDLAVTSRKTSDDVLHAAVRAKSTPLITTCIRKGADPFAKDLNGCSADAVTQDPSVHALLRQLSNAEADQTLARQQSPTYRGFLGKWTNLVHGFKMRWFVLDDGVLSYYQSPEDEGRHVRGSIYLRYATIRADSRERNRFDIISRMGKGLNKIYLRASDHAECVRWIQMLEKSQRFHEQESRDAGEVAGDGIPVGMDRTGSPAIARSLTPGVRDKLRAANMESLAVPEAGVRRPSVTSPDSYGGSISSFGAAHSAQSMEDDMHSEHDGVSIDGAHSAGMPHARKFAIVRNLLDTHHNLSAQIVEQLLAPAPAAPPTGLVRPVPRVAGAAALAPALGAPTEATPAQSLGEHSTQSDTVKALGESLDSRHRLWSEFAAMVSEREAYLRDRLERETTTQGLWEEQMATLAQQHKELESNLQEAVAVINAQRREIRELQSGGGGGAGGAGGAVGAGGMGSRTAEQGAPAPGAAGGMGSRTAEQGAPAPGAAGGAATAHGPTAAPSAGGSAPAPSPPSRERSFDDEEEFYDTVESGNLPNLHVEKPLEQPSRERSQENEPDDGNPAAGPEFAPYAHLREQMPISKDNRPPMSLWAILKNNIGKDLTKISFPVSFNEPTSMLQRMAEDMEFSECLDAAAMQADSTRRIAYVAAFACSNYSSTIGRIAKPFNPLLGETFEYARPDRGYRYVSEQVSHHPPISACFAESGSWEYMGCVDAKSKFLGRSFEIRPTGVAHVELKVPPAWVPEAKRASLRRAPHNADKVLEHFSWNKVTTSVSGFIVGAPTIDHYGDMTVVNHVTGDKCVLKFMPRGWRSADAREIRGEVYNANGQVVWEIAGRWNSQLVARRVGSESQNLNPDVNMSALLDPVASSQSDSNPYLLLWRNSEKKPAPFNLTPFAITLNSCPDDLRPWLPPTDCRLRPDLSAFESGRFDEADKRKGDLENLQRETRNKREAGALPPHKPRWFSRTTDGDSHAPFWKPETAQMPDNDDTMSYWVERERVGSQHVKGNTSAQWKDTPHIFGDEST
ncbi:hypothetical protein MSPP1_003090 [Malassezia sp. CBS 17886]|nr:hypothetical protein MSPP1_003090 [Malassezia sp. CBS 17886]